MKMIIGIDPGKNGGAVAMNSETLCVESHFLMAKESDTSMVEWMERWVAHTGKVPVHIGVEDIPVYIPNKGFRQQVSRLAPLFKSEGTWKGLALAFAKVYGASTHSIRPVQWQKGVALKEHTLGTTSTERQERTREAMVDEWIGGSIKFKYEIKALAEAYWIARFVCEQVK